MSISSEMDGEKKTEEIFMSLFASNRSELFAYIMALIARESEAEDIFQETCTIMWRKFDEFKEGTSFTAWGCKIAYYIILDHRRKAANSRIQYSSETLSLLSEGYSEIEIGKDYRAEKLAKCLDALSQRERLLVQLRYHSCLQVSEITSRLGMSLNGIYKLLAKVHYFLYECVQKSLAAEEGRWSQ